MTLDGQKTQERVGAAATATHRRFPRTLAAHLLRQFAFPLAGTLAAFVMVTLLLAVFDDLPDFNGVEISSYDTARYFLARIPENLTMVFPVSALLAVSFMTIVLGKNNELTAIRSAGLSLLTTALPIWLLALGLSLGVFCLSEFVQPACARFVERIQTDYLNNPAAEKGSAKQSKKADAKPLTLNQLAYYNPRNRQEWFFADYKPSEECHGLSICRQDESGRTINVLTAATAHFDTARNTWLLRECTLTQYRYEPGSTLALSEPPLFFAELPSEQWDTKEIYSESPRDISIQAQAIDRMPLKDLLRMKRRKILLTGNSQSLVRTMIAYRLFSPLASLIAILLGFALTLTRGRATPIRGFVVAIGIFVAYHLIAQFCLVLGKNGYLWWPIAGALPTIVALATALYLTYRRQ